MFVFLDNPLKQRLFCGTRCKDMLARVCILTNGACGNRLPSRAEILIPGGFAGLLVGYGVVFLWMVRWISFRR